MTTRSDFVRGRERFLKKMDLLIANVRSAEVIALQDYIREFMKQNKLTDKELFENYELHYEEVDPQLSHSLDDPETKFISLIHKVSLKPKERNGKASVVHPGVGDSSDK